MNDPTGFDNHVIKSSCIGIAKFLASSENKATIMHFFKAILNCLVLRGPIFKQGALT